MRQPVIFTIVTSNYTYRARSLFRQLSIYAPGFKQVLFVVDDGLVTRLEGDEFEVVRASSLAIPRFKQLVFALNPTALCCLLKSHAATFLLDFQETEGLIYLDSDMGVFSSLSDVLNTIQDYDLLLTPHLLAPPATGVQPGAKDLLPYGAFNAGFFAGNGSANMHAFMSWWATTLLDPCNSNYLTGYDQIWLNYAPAFLEHLQVLRHPGYNVAYWNIAERDFHERNNVFYCGSDRLVIFHFSSFNPLNPGKLTDTEDFCNYKTTAATKKLGEFIAREWENSGLADDNVSVPTKTHWADGTRIKQEERDVVSQLWESLDDSIDFFAKDFQSMHPELHNLIRGSTHTNAKSGFSNSKHNLCRVVRLFFGR
jgi:hypothetical protein